MNMNTKPYLLAIDQGTTSSRAIVFDREGNTVALAREEFPQHYPAEDRVEHDPGDLWSSTLAVSRRALTEAESRGGRVAAIGITNQRETTLLWDRQSGEPVCRAIVWQDRRTAGHCRRLRQQGCEADLARRSGLLLDPYFSATKVAWILDNISGARAKAAAGQLAFGTVDSYLIWRLSGGRVHATDITNASRTNLFNIHTQDWDEELLRLFDIPAAILPEIRECADDYGETDSALLGRALPILGVAGDQQAASIGQCCFAAGDIKSTYGTGCFVLVNTGSGPVQSGNRLLTTIASRIRGQTQYALEGAIFTAGAAVQWLRDGLGIIESADETETLAGSRNDNGGVYLVPAFTGLGAPHWDPHARAALFGLTQASGAAELARAVLESVCYQTHDLLQAMQEDGITCRRLRVDGGMVANDWLLQCLADVLDIEVERPVVRETTALGAAWLAGLQLGLYGDTQELTQYWQRQALFVPRMDQQRRRTCIQRWDRAVAATRAWSGEAPLQ